MMIKKYKQDESGVAAIEFGLVAPILILMLIATVDMGLYVMNSMHLQTLSHTVADYVVNTKSTDNLETVAAETYQGNYEDVLMTSALSCECSDGVAAECPLTCDEDDYSRRFVGITTQSTFNTLFPYPGVPDDITLERTVRLRVD